MIWVDSNSGCNSRLLLPRFQKSEKKSAPWQYSFIQCDSVREGHQSLNKNYVLRPIPVLTGVELSVNHHISLYRLGIVHHWTNSYLKDKTYNVSGGTVTALQSADFLTWKNSSPHAYFTQTDLDPTDAFNFFCFRTRVQCAWTKNNSKDQRRVSARVPLWRHHH